MPLANSGPLSIANIQAYWIAHEVPTAGSNLGWYRGTTYYKTIGSGAGALTVANTFPMTNLKISDFYNTFPTLAPGGGEPGGSGGEGGGGEGGVGE